MTPERWLAGERPGGDAPERIEFHTRPLASGLGVRVIRGFASRKGAVIDIFCRDATREFGRLSIYQEAGPIVDEAIDIARSGHDRRVVGEVACGSALAVRIEADGRRGTILLQRRRARDGAELGRPLTISGDELEALGIAIDWMGAQ